MVDRSRGPRQLDSRSRPRRRKPEPTAKASAWGSRWLAVAVVGLVALIAVSRVNRGSEPDEGAAAADRPPLGAAPVSPIPPPGPAAAPARPVQRPSVAQAPAPTPTLDLLVILEANRRIQRAGSAVYVDSLLAESDSVLRRWLERPGQPVTVAFLRDSIFTAARVDERPIREAFARWQELPIGLQFSVVGDTISADLLVQWIERFEPEQKRTGQTDLEVAPGGAIQHARITLSLRDPMGAVLDRAALTAAATHEVSHALGLGHSDRPGDVMFATPRSATLSVRDRRTAELIYGLPPGSVKTGT